MVDNLEKILKAFEGDKRTRMYGLLKGFLESSAYFLYFESPQQTMHEARQFSKPAYQRRLGEVKATLLIEICWRTRLFKSKFPNLNHKAISIGILFWDPSELWKDFKRGPPLVPLDMVADQMTPRALPKIINDFKVYGPELRKWL